MTPERHWFDMSSAYTPLGTFLKKAQADQIRELLEREGLNATVRSAGDSPPGWQNAPGQNGFELWVQDADPKLAMEICLRVMAKAFPVTCCEVCGSNHATQTIYVITGRKRTVRHLCAECHGKNSRPEEQSA